MTKLQEAEEEAACINADSSGRSRSERLLPPPPSFLAEIGQSSYPVGKGRERGEGAPDFQIGLEGVTRRGGS